MCTAELPFQDIPSALLGHRVVNENLRPVFPAGTPEEYVDLTMACWVPNADDR